MPPLVRKPGHVVVAVEQRGRPAHDLALDRRERRERLRVQGVLVEVEAGRLLGDLVHRRTTVVDHAERLAVRPSHVVRPLLGELTDHLVDRSALLPQ